MHARFGAGASEKGCFQYLVGVLCYKNVGEVLQKILAQHLDVLQEAAREALPADPSQEPAAVASQAPSTMNQTTEDPEQASSPSSVSAPPTPALHGRQPPRRKPAPLRKQRRWQLEMYQQVHRLSAEGRSQREISEQLHLHPHTVRKYLRMEQFVDQRHNPHGSSVEPYRAYLQERWSQGCTMAKTRLPGTVCPRLYGQLQECLSLHASVVPAAGWRLCPFCPQGCDAAAPDAVADQVAALACSRRAFATRCQLLPGRLSSLPSVGASSILGSQVCADGAPAPARPVRCMAEGKPAPACCKNCTALRSGYGKKLEPLVPRCGNHGVPGKSKGRLPGSNSSNARCMGEPTLICCVYGCYMRLDDLIRETHKTALLQQKESGAALLLLQASIRKRNPDTSASASAAIVPGLLLALLVLASSKVGKSHDVGIPYTACGSCCSLRLKGLCENRYAKEPAQSKLLSVMSSVISRSAV